ncbi:MAG: glycosyltransferase family 2 protein [Anaerolineae bacterium]|nr:glycosyltransferase family 2 protein [Anaerolineae bacterium]
MSSPLVSVILPVYNGARFLRQALESIRAQTYTPYEILVIDDGSIDASAGIARSFPGVQYHRQPNQGVAHARNTGLALAQGVFIGFLDQDDLWTPGKLERQVAHLQRHPETGYVLAKQEIFLEPGAAPPPWLKQALLLEQHTGYILGTCLARREVFDRVGRFDPHYRLGSDADWFFRAKDLALKMDVLDVALLHKRIHDDNESYRTEENSRELLKLVRASIHRQRGKARA